MEKTKEKRKIGVGELMGYGIGNCIGSGIFVSMGLGIYHTGRSITLALVCACVVVLFAYGYKTLMAGMFALPGGRYSQSALLQPPMLVGVSAVSMIFSGLAFSMYAISVTDYAKAVFPQIEPYEKLIAVLLITLFFLTTLLGGKFMGIFNVVMVGVLIVSLMVYLIVGLTKVDFATANPFSEGYFKGGPVGFFMAVATMAFACQGATMPIDMTKDAKDPKKKIPIAILLTSLVIMVIYALVGIVSSGILPIEAVAKQNLSAVAKQIFPYPVFVIFIIGGACFAIATSLYSTIAGIQHPLLSTVKDGWLPEFFGKTTKKGYPYVIMSLLYVIAVVPVFVDFGLQNLISVMMIPVMILNTVNNVLVLRVIKKYPVAWKNSFFHMPKWALTATVVFATLCSALITVALFTQLERNHQILLVIAVVLIFAFSYYRIKTGKVNLKDIELAREEAEAAAMAEENASVKQ